MMMNSRYKKFIVLFNSHQNSVFIINIEQINIFLKIYILLFALWTVFFETFEEYCFTSDICIYIYIYIYIRKNSRLEKSDKLCKVFDGIKTKYKFDSIVCFLVWEASVHSQVESYPTLKNGT